MSQLFSPFPPLSMFLGPIFGRHSTLKLGGRGFLAFLPVVRTFFTIIVATLIDIRNPFFTRKIKKLNKKLLELKTCNFWLKIRNF